MGKVKAWVMDMEEEFFDYVTEDDHLAKYYNSS